MSAMFLVNYITGRQQITNFKVDRWLSSAFSTEKKYMSRNNSRIFMFVGTTYLYEYMNLLRNYVYNLFVNTHVPIKIDRKLYQGIIYIANEGRHVRIYHK